MKSPSNPVYLYVTPFFPSPTRWDGAYGLDFVRAFVRVTEGRAALGDLRVLVFVPGAGEDYEIEGVRVCRFPTKQLPSNILPFLHRRYNEASFLKKVRETVADGSVRYCHANTAPCAIYALAAQRAFGARAILHHHDLASFGLNVGVLRHCWLNNVLHYPILRRLIERVDLHVFCSEASRRSLQSVPDAGWTVFDDYRRQFRGLGFFRSPRIGRSVVLHNGVDERMFCRAAGTPKAGEAGTFVLGCIGNFQELKDQLTLLEAFRLLRERGLTQLRLKLLGGDSTLGRLQHVLKRRTYLEKCRRFVREHRLEGCVEFLPEVRHETLPDFYRSLDLFVLPSFFEGFGCVYAEAFACGVPFIACEGQGIGDVIAADERARWLVPPRDPQALAARIADCVAHPGLPRLTEDVGLEAEVRKYADDLEAIWSD